MKAHTMPLWVCVCVSSATIATSWPRLPPISRFLLFILRRNCVCFGSTLSGDGDGEREFSPSVLCACQEIVNFIFFLHSLDCRFGSSTRCFSTGDSAHTRSKPYSSISSYCIETLFFVRMNECTWATCGVTYETRYPLEHYKRCSRFFFSW